MILSISKSRTLSHEYLCYFLGTKFLAITIRMIYLEKKSSSCFIGIYHCDRPNTMKKLFVNKCLKMDHLQMFSHVCAWEKIAFYATSLLYMCKKKNYILSGLKEKKIFLTKLQLLSNPIFLKYAFCLNKNLTTFHSYKRIFFLILIQIFTYSTILSFRKDYFYIHTTVS